MFKKNPFPAAIISALLLAAPLTAAAPHKAFAYAGQELASQAKVTIEQARATALKTVQGEITDEELENEGGGLRYSFDVKRNGKTYEVGIDAQTGAVLEHKVEGPNPD